MKRFLLILMILSAGYGTYSLLVIGPQPPVANDAEKIVQEKGLTSAEIKEVMIGKWQSLGDTNFTREFKADGSAIDSYSDGEISDREILSWEIFDGKNPEEGFVGQPEAGASYLSMSNGRDSLIFKIGEVTPEKLALVYLDRRETLTFKKIN